MKAEMNDNGEIMLYFMLLYLKYYVRILNRKILKKMTRKKFEQHSDKFS